MIIYVTIWEIFIFDTIRAIVTIKIYKNLLENGDSLLE